MTLYPPESISWSPELQREDHNVRRLLLWDPATSTERVQEIIKQASINILLRIRAFIPPPEMP